MNSSPLANVLQQAMFLVFGEDIEYGGIYFQTVKRICVTVSSTFGGFADLVQNRCEVQGKILIAAFTVNQLD